VGWCSARGTCNGGADAGQSCDHNPDCASGSCSANTNLTETTMVLKRNTVRFSKGGFGSSPYKCSDHLSGACATATANCRHRPGDCGALLRSGEQYVDLPDLQLQRVLR
jgi:hypothetical protein